jgi:hypothetical protein
MHELLVFGTKTDSSHQPRTEIRTVESRVYPSISTFIRSLKPGDASRSPYLAPTPPPSVTHLMESLQSTPSYLFDTETSVKKLLL